MKYLLLLPVLMLACRETPKELPPVPGEKARIYNDRIVALHDSVAKAKDSLSLAIAGGTLPASRRAVDAFRRQLARLADSLRAVPAFEGDTTLRTAALQLFKAYADEAAATYAMLPVIFTEDAIDTLRFPDSIQPWDSLDPHDRLAETYPRLDRKAPATAKALKNFLEVQQKFAEKFGFRLAIRPVDEIRI